jgi:hypothetical protein
LSLDVLATGTHRVDLTYINPFEGQHVVVACNKRRVEEFELPVGPAPQHLILSLPLKAGSNSVELAFRLWETPDSDGRALAMMLTDVTIELEHPATAAAA